MRIEDGSQASQLRFVLLHHLMPAQAQGDSHWDLMLEQGDVLLTLQLEELPLDSEPGRVRELRVKCLPAHRLAYLDYEGEISGGRGHVKRITGGGLVVHMPEPSVMRCSLTSESLFAEIEFPRRLPGETICLKIISWRWTPAVCQ